MIVKGKAFGALCIRAEEIVFLNLELSSKEWEASAKGFICWVFAGNSENYSWCWFVLAQGFCGRPSERASELDTWVEFFNLRMDCGEDGCSWDAVKDDRVPDFIFSETNGCGNSSFDGFFNSWPVAFENTEDKCVVFCKKKDVVVGGELSCYSRGFLNCWVEGIISYCEKVGVIW